MTRTISLLVLTLLALATSAQQPAAAPKPIPMPSDRAADSYAIYSQLLQSIALDLGNPARKVWLVEDTTIIPPSPLYAAIRPPAGREADLQALIDDYVRHESETIALASDGFHTELPVRLLDEAARKRFRESVRFGMRKTRRPGLSSMALPGCIASARSTSITPTPWQWLTSASIAAAVAARGGGLCSNTKTGVGFRFPGFIRPGSHRRQRRDRCISR